MVMDGCRDEYFQCREHSGQCAKVEVLERDLERQVTINKELWEKIDKITGRLNLIMGGVFVLWPALQVIFWFANGRPVH
jgi:hypothetical protein